jgi:hypothetical protein
VARIIGFVCLSILGAVVFAFWIYAFVRMLGP